MSSVKSFAQRVSKVQNFLLTYWIPNAIFLFILSYFILPSSKAVNNFFYAALLAPAIICINRLEWHKSWKINNIKIFYTLAAFSIISLLWSPVDTDKGKGLKHIFYTVFYVQILLTILLTQNREWLYTRLKQLLLFAVVLSFVYAKMNIKSAEGRFVLPTKMDHPIQLASVLGLGCLTALYIAYKEQSLKLKFTYFFIYILFTAMIIKTGSRGPLLALAVSTTLVIVIQYRKIGLIVIISLNTLPLLFVYHHFSKTNFQVNRFKSSWQEINLLKETKNESEIEAVSVRLVLEGEGNIKFDKVSLLSNGNKFFEETFENETHQWISNKDTNVIRNKNTIELVNNKNKNVFLRSKFIRLPQPAKQIELRFKAKSQVPLRANYCGVKLDVRFKDGSEKTFRSRKRLSRLFQSLKEERRFNLWKKAINKSLEKPLIGHGYSTDCSIKIDNLVLFHSHNIWTETFFKLGSVGLILLFLLIYKHKNINIRIFPLLLFALICAFFDMPKLFTSTKELWLYFLIPLILWIVTEAQTREPQQP